MGRQAKQMPRPLPYGEGHVAAEKAGLLHREDRYEKAVDTLRSGKGEKGRARNRISSGPLS